MEMQPTHQIQLSAASPLWIWSHAFTMAMCCRAYLTDLLPSERLLRYVTIRWFHPHQNDVHLHGVCRLVSGESTIT